MKNLLSRFVRDDRGQDLIEYAMLAGFVALASVAAIRALGVSLTGGFTAFSLALGSVGVGL